jgi:hypothetical protein
LQSLPVANSESVKMVQELMRHAQNIEHTQPSSPSET